MPKTRQLAAPIALALLLLAAPAMAAPPAALAGTWQVQQEDGVVELTLRADGSFARRDLAGDGEASRITGRWTIPADGGRLRLQFEDWAPRQACGLTGCTPIRMPAGETYRFRLDGEDRLLLDHAGGRLELRRAG